MDLRALRRRGRAVGRPAALIVIRDSPEWDRLDHSYLETTTWMDQVVRQPPGFTKSFVELWDDTFRTSFFQVRHALKTISLRTFAAVRGAKVVSVDSITRWPPAGLTFFTDDDDWFAPDVVEQVMPLARDRDGVTWETVDFNGGFSARTHEVWAPNGYAVNARAPIGSTWRKYVFMHGAAYTTFRNSGFSHVRHPSVLSVMNRHPASTLTIRNALEEIPGRDGLVALLESFLARVAAAPPPPPDLPWAHEPAAATVEVFSGLKLR